MDYTPEPRFTCSHCKQRVRRLPFSGYCSHWCRRMARLDEEAEAALDAPPVKEEVAP